jgi:hypothetical protein
MLAQASFSKNLLRNSLYLKGHGFSRASRDPENCRALASEGMSYSTAFIPAAAEAGLFLSAPSARLKPCPFRTQGLFVSS